VATPELSVAVRPEPPVPAAGRGWRPLALGVPALAALVVGALGVGVAIPALVRVAMVVVGFVALVRAVDDALCRRGHPRGDAGFYFSAGWLVLLVLAAALADVLPLGEGRVVARALRVPTLLPPDLLSAHPLGTDGLGLDILAEILYGTRVSLTVSVGAVAIATVVGGAIGLAAGYYRGTVERTVSILTDSLLAFPPIALLLAMVAVLRPGILNVTLALAVLVIPVYIRLVRANTLAFTQREFVTAARSLGASNTKIIFREIIPNLVPSVVSYGLLVVPVLIAAEATLSFLGLGIQRPNPTWGNLIAAGKDDFETYPNLVFAPGVTLFLAVFALNRVAAKVRSRWDVVGR